jgi:glutamate:GABA antiporter
LEEVSRAERAKLRRELGRLDTIFFLISAMVVVDTIGAIAIGGGEAFTWLVVLFLFFFIPSALASAELGAAIPEEGGGYVWVRTAFGRYAGALTSLLYWAGTPMWLGGSVAVVAMSVYQRFIGDLSGPAMYGFGALFIGAASVGAVVPPQVRQVGAEQRRGRADRAAGPVYRQRRRLWHASWCAWNLAGDLSPSRAAFIAVVPVLLGRPTRTQPFRLDSRESACSSSCSF